MRSLIVIEVEHGETTDPVSEFLDIIPGTNENHPHEQDGLEVLGYSVAVDIPQYVAANNVASFLHP